MGHPEMSAPITALWLDIGGVVLTNGCDHLAREWAAQRFELAPAEFAERHRLTFEAYELGKLTLDEYLDLVVFYRKRSFSRADFQKFMFDQSQPYPEMIDLARRLKERFRLKIGVVSNEGRELNAYRIRKFGLAEWVDFFVSSSFVGLRKPDKDIFRLALDLGQVPNNQILYIENTPLFVQIAAGLGIKSLLHTDYRSTEVKLAKQGLALAPTGPDPAAESTAADKGEKVNLASPQGHEIW